VAEIVVLALERPTEDMAAQAPYPAVLQRFVVRVSEELERPDFVEAFVAPDCPLPSPAGMAADAHPGLEAATAVETDRRRTVAAPPPIADPAPGSSCFGTGVEYPLLSVTVVAELGPFDE
jgi:hypothetical protein